jgi:hypothetical protein
MTCIVLNIRYVRYPIAISISGHISPLSLPPPPQHLCLIRNHNGGLGLCPSRGFQHDLLNFVSRKKQRWAVRNTVCKSQICNFEDLTKATLELY